MPARTRYYATAAAAAAVAAVAAVVVRRRRRRRPVGYSVRDYNPPLPDEVAHMLESCSLCYLATASGDPPEPHLSLMNFTYVRGDEVIVFTSRSDTLKMQNLNSNSSVSLLVHDFPSNAPSSGTLAITLSGITQVETGARAERFKALHLAHNPKSAHFIEGEGKDVVSVRVTNCRMCDSSDKVKQVKVA